MITNFKNFLLENNNYIEQIEDLLFNGNVEKAKTLAKKFNSEQAFEEKYQYLAKFFNDMFGGKPKPIFDYFGYGHLEIKKNSKPNDDIYLLKQLKTLIFNGCEVSEISSKISNLVNLKKLEIENINITKLPKELNELKQLSSIELKKLNIKEVPILSNLKKLYIVSLSDLKIADLNFLNGCSDLATLLVDNTNISEIPEFIINNSNSFYALSVTNSKLTQIPKNVHKVDTLLLDFSGNPIVELNDEFFKIKKDITLDNCLISDITSSMINKDLDLLSIANNPICKDNAKMAQLQKQLPNTRIEI